MADLATGLRGLKVCLVFPPYRVSYDGVFLPAAKRKLGIIPPLALTAVAAVLEQAGARVQIIDANAAEIGIEEACALARQFGPDLLGFTLSTYQLGFTLEWIKAMRKATGAKVIAGGPHARIYPKEILSHDSVDYLVLGDAEVSLVQLVDSLSSGGPVSGVPSIAYRDPSSGACTVNPGELFFRELDAVPMPSRHLLDNSLYYSLISKYRNFTAMTTTRGCVYQCSFCDNHTLPYRAMSPERVVEEMEICARDFGIREIDMFDGVFSIDRQRLLRICSLIGRRKLKIYWSIRTRTDLVDRECLKALRAAGCARIYYGIESGSRQILANIRKGTDLEAAKDVVAFTRKAGIETFGYFMVGSPGETAESVDQTLRLMLSLPLDFVQIAPIFYPPNTEIYSRLVKMTGIDHWREYTLYPDHPVQLPVMDTYFSSRQELYEQVKKMYLRFYLRPSQLLKLALKIKSPAALRRQAGAVLDMISQSQE